MEEHDFLQFFMGLISQVKLYHWSTMSYAKHKALDKLHESLSDKVDLLVESYVGRFNKQPIKHFTIKTKANTNTKGDIIEKYLATSREEILVIHNKFDKAVEIQNILQDIMAEIDSTIYLCKLS